MQTRSKTGKNQDIDTAVAKPDSQRLGKPIQTLVSSAEERSLPRKMTNHPAKLLCSYLLPIEQSVATTGCSSKTKRTEGKNKVTYTLDGSSSDQTDEVDTDKCTVEEISRKRKFESDATACTNNEELSPVVKKHKLEKKSSSMRITRSQSRLLRIFKSVMQQSPSETIESSTKLSKQ